MFEKPTGYDSDTDDSYYSSSDDEFESEKAKMRAREDRDYLINKTFGTEETEMTATGPVRRKKANADRSDSSDHELEQEYVKDSAKHVELKDAHRRGINRGSILHRIDKDIKEQKGKRQELKILQTKNPQRAKKQVSSNFLTFFHSYF